MSIVRYKLAKLAISISLGAIIFYAYSAVYHHPGTTDLVLGNLLKVLAENDGFKEWQAAFSFERLTSILDLTQSLILSLAFSVIWWGVLRRIPEMRAYSDYISLGIVIGLFLPWSPVSIVQYLMKPFAAENTISVVFERLIDLPATVLLWYLPFVIMMYLVGVIAQKQRP